MAVLQGYSHPIDPHTIELVWQHDESDPPLVSIARSEAPHEGFQTLSTTVSTDTGHYTDTLSVPNENRAYYYKVGGILLDNGGPPNPLAKEIVRRDRWFLQSDYRHSGARKAEAKIRFVDGAKCPECWDPIHQKIRTSKCSTCNGTGVLLSYSSKIDIRIARSMQSFQRAPQAEQISQSADTQYWTSNYPLLKPGDLLRTGGLIHRIEQVQRTRSGSYVVKQILVAKRLDVHREEYSIDWE